MGKEQRKRKTARRRPPKQCKACRRQLHWEPRIEAYVDKDGYTYCPAKAPPGKLYSLGEHTF